MPKIDQPDAATVTARWPEPSGNRRLRQDYHYALALEESPVSTFKTRRGATGETGPATSMIQRPAKLHLVNYENTTASLRDGDGRQAGP